MIHIFNPYSIFALESKIAHFESKLLCLIHIFGRLSLCFNLNTMINQQQLVDWLQMTLQAKTIQDGATLIQNARFSEGFTIQLLLIVDNHSYGIDIRQTALVTLKTTVDALYSPHKPGDPELSANDKNILRGSILEGKPIKLHSPGSEL